MPPFISLNPISDQVADWTEMDLIEWRQGGKRWNEVSLWMSNEQVSEWPKKAWMISE